MLACRREFLVAALVVFLSTPRPAAAQVAVTGTDGTVSIHATQATLGSVMRALERVVTFEQLKLDPSVDQVSVSVAFDELNVRSALRAILEAAEVNYVLLADEDGKSIRLAASRSAFVGRLDQRPRDAMVERAPAERIDRVDAAADSAPSVAESRESQRTFRFGSGGQIGGGSVTGRGGSFSSVGQAQAFEHALIQPAVPAAPGTVVPLPFPDALGAPLVSVIPPKDPNANAGPLPGISTSPQPSQQGQPASSTKPLDALSPKPRR
jgi:hypothetical protein